MICLTALPETCPRDAAPGRPFGRSFNGVARIGTGGGSLAALLAAFDPISLSQMDGVALQDRSEVKYLMPGNVLPLVLGELRQAYDVLVVENTALSRYRTLYFDTADFALYRRHHAGALNCFKVRSREYVETSCAFLEVKHKTNKKRTIKQRIQTGELVTFLDEGAGEFLESACPYQAQDLRPCLWNTYTRVTLVGKTRRERVTIDINLDFAWQGRRASLPGLVVAEVKRERGSCTSPFVDLMWKYHVHSTGFSKFCMGVSLLHPEVKHNNFKAKLRLAARLMEGGLYDIN